MSRRHAREVRPNCGGYALPVRAVLDSRNRCRPAMRANLMLPTVMFLALFAAHVGASGVAGAQPQLSAAEEAYMQNLVLGNALAGRPADTGQAAEAERLFQRALAEAHRLACLILCTAYRPVTIPAEQVCEEELPEGESGAVVILRRGAATDCEEGLAEMRAAMRLKPADPEYRLDYAEALSTCSEFADCEEQALALWENRSAMSNLQCSRCARLLADCACSRGDPNGEIRWLRAAVKYDPKDKAVAKRLETLVAAQPKAVWVSYEAGKAIAESEQKPMLIYFAAEWCGWCRKLETDVFSRPGFATLSEQLVCIRVDEAERRDLISTFNLEAYPTTVVLDHTRRELHRIRGYRPAEQYLAQLKNALATE